MMYTPLSQIPKSLPIPKNWPGTYDATDTDKLYHIRDQCYQRHVGPNLDMWTKDAQQCRLQVDKTLYQLGKNPCQRNTFSKTPVFWF